MARAATCLAVLGIAAAPAPARADPMAYSARAIDARLVDDVSGAPVAGAVVVASWTLAADSRLIPGGHEGRALRILEAVSGADGRFGFPAWGPLPRPPGFHLEHRDPQLMVLAPGYYPRTLANEVTSSYNRSASRESQWHGREIRLRPFTGKPQRWREDHGRFRDEASVDGTLEELATRYAALQIELGWHRQADDWKRYPRMVRALMQERERLASAGFPKALAYLQPIAALHGGERAVRAYLERSAP
jgi:hypothetical protein